VDYGLQMTVQVLTLATGFVLVLWGLRIFKLWVACLGLAFGGVAGGLIGALAIGSDQAALIGIAIGALAGGILSWPLQKLTVIATAGITAAGIAAAAAVASSGSGHVVAITIVGFIAGIILAALLFDAIVITGMAMSGALLVFQAMFVPFDTWYGTPRQVAERTLGYWGDNVVALIATITIFTAFSWIYQKRLSRRRIATSPMPERVIAARRVPFRIALVTLAAIGITAALAVAGFDTATSYELLGFHALSWPLVALAAAAFMAPRGRILQDAGDDAPPIIAWRSRGFLATAAFVLIVPPLITGALFMLYGLDPTAIVRFYRAFVLGDPATIAAKVLLSFGLIPLVLVRAVPASARKRPPRQSPPPQVAVAPETAAPLAATPA
jgi:hypothetical protein